VLGLVLESGVRLAKCWSTAPSRNCTSRSGLEMLEGSQTSPHRLDSGRLRRAGRFGPRPADLANFASTLIPRKRVKAGGSRERPNGFAALWPGVNASPPLVADSNRECTPIDPPPRTTTRQAANWSIFKFTFIGSLPAILSEVAFPSISPFLLKQVSGVGSGWATAGSIRGRFVVFDGDQAALLPSGGQFSEHPTFRIR
jgi:hypothetical protein